MEYLNGQYLYCSILAPMFARMGVHHRRPTVFMLAHAAQALEAPSSSYKQVLFRSNEVFCGPPMAQLFPRGRKLPSVLRTIWCGIVLFYKLPVLTDISSHSLRSHHGFVQVYMPNHGASYMRCDVSAVTGYSSSIHHCLHMQRQQAVYRNIRTAKGIYTHAGITQVPTTYYRPC